MSEIEPKIVVLSRYFDANVRLVAGMCSKCYSECDDVKIVAVNRVFLQKIENITAKLKKEGHTLHEVELKTESECTYSVGQTSNCVNTSADIEIIDKAKTSVSIKFDKIREGRVFPVRNTYEIHDERTSKYFGPNLKNNNCPNMEDLNKNLESVKLESDEVFPKCTPPGSQAPLWSPPRSPHNLIEESLYHDPWALLVATIFLNKTQCMYARPCIDQFLKDFPTPSAVIASSPGDLEPYFSNIGLKKRSEQVWRMSWDFVHKNWKNVKELYGIGKYGDDAFRIFCLGDLNVQPNDRFLKIYQAWYNMKQKGNACGAYKKSESDSEESDGGC